MQAILSAFLKRMPIWFGLFFLGPVVAEIILRTPIADWIAMVFSVVIVPQFVYIVCISLGGLWGIIAYKVGRWI